MKTLIALLGIVVLLAFLAAGADPSKAMPKKDLMRQKLANAQHVLEGIALQDYDLLAANAAKLGALSQESAWLASDAAEYAEHSAAFRRSVEALKKAARERNLDAASLAYTKLTFSCVECHKFMRGRKVASTGSTSILFVAVPNCTNRKDKDMKTNRITMVAGMFAGIAGTANAPDGANQRRCNQLARTKQSRHL